MLLPVGGHDIFACSLRLMEQKTLSQRMCHRLKRSQTALRNFLLMNQPHCWTKDIAVIEIKNAKAAPHSFV